MAAACIVFVSDIPNHTELIKNKKNGFTFSLNEDDFINYL